MRDIVAIVTGATGGIGFETALGIARRGAEVVVVGRSEAKCRDAVSRIAAQAPQARLSYLVADLFLQSENRRLAAEIAARYPRVNVLVNNVGAVFMKHGLTSEGVEHTLALNHLGPYVLTRLLLPTLSSNAPARIVNVSSVAHYGVSLNFPGLDFSGWVGYQRSKLANVLFTIELARRIGGTGVTVNALHPGLVASGFGMNNTGLFPLLKPFVNLVAISNEAGAKTSIYVSSSVDVEGETGGYYDRCKLKQPSAAGRDAGTAAQLWDVSARMTGMPVD